MNLYLICQILLNNVSFKVLILLYLIWIEYGIYIVDVFYLSNKLIFRKLLDPRVQSYGGDKKVEALTQGGQWILLINTLINCLYYIE